MRRYFQWITGDDFGKVETLAGIRYEKGEYFFDFDSGDSMNMRFVAAMTNDPNSLHNRFLVEIKDPYDRWGRDVKKPRVETVGDADGNNITVEVPPIDDIVGATKNSDGDYTIERSSVGKVTLIPPAFRGPFLPLPDPADYFAEENERKITAMRERRRPEEDRSAAPEPEKITAPSAPTAAVVIDPPAGLVSVDDVGKPAVIKAPAGVISESDPVWILVNSSKKTAASMDVTIEIGLPSKDLYRLVATQFDGGADKFEKIIRKYIVDSLTTGPAAEQIVKSVMEEYRSGNE